MAALLKKSQSVCFSVSGEGVHVVHNGDNCRVLVAPVSSQDIVDAAASISIDWGVSFQESAKIKLDVRVVSNGNNWWNYTLYGENQFSLVWKGDAWKKPAGADMIELQPGSLLLGKEYADIDYISVPTLNRDGYTSTDTWHRNNDGDLYYSIWPLLNAITGVVNLHKNGEIVASWAISGDDEGVDPGFNNQGDVKVSIPGIVALAYGDNYVKWTWKSPLFELNVDTGVTIVASREHEASGEFDYPVSLNYKDVEDVSWKMVPATGNGKFVIEAPPTNWYQLEFVYDDGILSSNGEQVRYEHRIQVIAAPRT